MPVCDKLLELEGTTILDGSLKLGKLLGYGGCGAVYEAKSNDASAAPVAVKVVNREDLHDLQLCLLDNEIYFHEMISGMHKNILKFIGSYEQEDENGNFIYFITELCSEGDLYNPVFTFRGYVGLDSIVRKDLIPILDAVQSLHDIGLYHRDIKPENIFEKDDGTLVLGDFGFITDKRKHSDIGLGTTCYMSPELLGGYCDDETQVDACVADTWALGVTLFNMVTGQYPWMKANFDDDEFCEYFTDSQMYFKRKFNVTYEANALFRSIFAKRPSDRLSLSEIREKVLSIRFTPRKNKKSTPLITKLESSMHKSFQLHIVNTPPSVDNSDQIKSLACSSTNYMLKEFSDFGNSIASASSSRSAVSVVRKTVSESLQLPDYASGSLQRMIVSDIHIQKPSRPRLYSTISDSESEGPETPETIPMDAQIMHSLTLTADIDTLRLDGETCLKRRPAMKIVDVRMRMPDTFDLSPVLRLGG